MKIPSLNPGDFPHLVQIMREPDTPSQITRNLPLELFAEVWAKIHHPKMPSNQSDGLGNAASRVFARIETPYLSGVAANMQVFVQNGNTYLIEDVVNELQMNVKLILHCTMIGANVQ